MNIIQFFGDLLAEYSGKQSIACRGLLRFAIKDQFGETLENLGYSDLVDVFQGPLKIRLEKLNIATSDQIIHDMISQLNRNQSLLTLATV